MMFAVPCAQSSKPPNRPPTPFRNASLLSTARRFDKHNIMTRTPASHALHPRQRNEDGAGTQSFTFGLAFMAILLSLLFFAHMMQRVANRRQREALARMAALQEARELEMMPKLWDVHISRASSRQEDEKNCRWKDLQPLSAHVVNSDLQTSAGPHDRPLRISIIIAMPVSPTIGSRRESGKCLEDEADSEEPPYYELGVTTVK